LYQKKENPVYCLQIYPLQALEDEIGLHGTRLVGLVLAIHCTTSPTLSRARLRLSEDQIQILVDGEGIYYEYLRIQSINE